MNWREHMQKGADGRWLCEGCFTETSPAAFRAFPRLPRNPWLVIANRKEKRDLGLLTHPAEIELHLAGAGDGLEPFFMPAEALITAPGSPESRAQKALSSLAARMQEIAKALEDPTLPLHEKSGGAASLRAVQEFVQEGIGALQTLPPEGSPELPAALHRLAQMDCIP